MRWTWLVPLALLLTACGDDGPTAPDVTEEEQAPPTVDLHVVVTTSGADHDPDGYAVRLDGGSPRAVQAQDTATFADLSPGAHTLELDGLAANCAADGGTTRTVELAPDDVAVIERFEVTCSGLTGSILVAATMDGPGDDPDGFDVLLDGVASGRMNGAGEHGLTGVAVGDHVVALHDVDGNCAVHDGTERSVTVTPDDATSVAFAITCDLKRGTLLVTTATSGWTGHAGYGVTVAGADTTASADLGAEGEVAFEGLPVGSYTAELTAPETCSGARDGAADVGEGITTTLAFSFTCHEPRGSLEILVVTHGPHPDPDGYVVGVAGLGDLPVEANAAIVLDDVAADTYGLGLSGLEAWCTPQPGNPTTVTVRSRERARVVLEVDCRWLAPLPLAPTRATAILQNDPAIPCADHATRGRGYRIVFDWTDTGHPSGIDHYEIFAIHRGARFPIVHRRVAASTYTDLSCNGFVADANLDGWLWWVRAVARDGTPGLWTGPTEFGFSPCRLSDGRACSAP